MYVCMYVLGVTFAAGVLRSVSNSETGRKRLLHTGLVENISTVLKSIETNKLLRSIAILPMYVLYVCSILKEVCIYLFIYCMYVCGWIFDQILAAFPLYVICICVYVMYIYVCIHVDV